MLLWINHAVFFSVGSFPAYFSISEIDRYKLLNLLVFDGLFFVSNLTEIYEV
jgi:hypothetical protein